VGPTIPVNMGDADARREPSVPIPDRRGLYHDHRPCGAGVERDV